MRLRRALLAAAACALAAGAAAAASDAPPFAPGEAVEIRTVLDPTTATLADGRLLRLAGIDAPAPVAAEAKAGLERLVAGKRLELRYAGATTDRAGHVVAELYAGGRWVERSLVARGLVRVRGAADERLGLVELLAAEDRARHARRGLWREPGFAVRDAADAARDAGTWQIVEGMVAAVTSGSDGVSLVFGPDRATAFSAHIARPALALFRAAGLSPASLEGTRLRVRGFIDGTRRPSMEVSFPEQIERP